MIRTILHQSGEGPKIRLSVWIVCFIFIELMWTFIGGFFTYYSQQIISRLIKDPIIARYIVLNINFVVLLLLIIIIVKFVLNYPILSFITSKATFRWSMMWTSLGIWVAIATFAGLARYMASPVSIAPVSPVDTTTRIVFIALVLVCTPLQCIAEELLFRTYLWRMLGRYRIIPLFVSAVAFSLAHLANQEITAARYPILVIAYYFATGLLFMELTMRSEGSEVAFGAHIGNNLFIAIGVNYSGSTLVGYPFFIQSDIPALYDIVLLVICSLVVIAVLPLFNKSGSRPYHENSRLR